MRTEEPTHAEKLFRGPVPQEGDLVISVDEEDRLIAKRIRAIGTGISFWKPFIIDVGEKGGLVQRSMTNNKPYALQ